MSFAYGGPITVIRAGRKRDPFSGELTGERDWDNATEHDEQGFAWAPGVTDEGLSPSSAEVAIAGTLYGPYGADVGEFDRVRIDGVEYAVDGRPARWRNPFTGWEAGLSMLVREIV